jgi:hypothetical protein
MLPQILEDPVKVVDIPVSHVQLLHQLNHFKCHIRRPDVEDLAQAMSGSGDTLSKCALAAFLKEPHDLFLTN